MGGLVYNARFFDRSFLNELDREQWLSIASLLQDKLRDEVLWEAIYDMPEAVSSISGNEIFGKLCSRRDKLVDFAFEHYKLLAKRVDVVGTNDRDLFLVNRINDSLTKVIVQGLDDDGEKRRIIYERIFHFPETAEICLYGKEDKDIFKITGNVNQGPLIRQIGGKGKDDFFDYSTVNGWRRKNIIYDKYSKTDIAKSSETRLHLSDDNIINEYKRKLFKYNLLMPLFYGGYNVDDGVFLGGGGMLHTYRFRDSSMHRLQARYALKTGAHSFRYSNHFSNIFPYWNLITKIEVHAPDYSNNFFGFGNETKIPDQEHSLFKDPYKYFRVRYNHYHAGIVLNREMNIFNFFAGPFFEHCRVKDNEGKFISSGEVKDIDSSVFMSHNYYGLSMGIGIDSRNETMNPSRGLFWAFKAKEYISVNSSYESHFNFITEFRTYLSLKRNPRAILAYRLAFERNFGPYDFFHAVTLGMEDNLRGYRSKRFSGDAAFWQNIELRYRVGSLNSYWLRGDYGFLSFFDTAKVWYKNESSSLFHNGYGLGLWISPFNATIFSASYNWSEEDSMLNVGFNFFY